MKRSLDMRKILRSASYGSRPRPARDWFLLLGAAAAFAAASAAWNAWFYREVQRESAAGEAVEAGAFDRGPVESVRALFEERRLEAERYRDEYRFVDPAGPRRYDAAASDTPL